MPPMSESAGIRLLAIDHTDFVEFADRRCLKLALIQSAEHVS